MTVEIVDFLPVHLGLIKVQQAQEHELAESEHHAQWTALADGYPICVGGLQEVWTGRAYAYALLAANAGPHMLALTRSIRFLLARATFARIEMVVEAEFAAGCRWAELLGFELETPTPLRRFLPSGRDAWIYARIKDGLGTVRSAGNAVRGRGVRHGSGRR